jgi:hypothetical protein
LHFEFFLTELYASARRSGGSRPSLFDVADLAGRYRDEFAIAEIPQPVQRIVFPLLRAVGTLLGRYRRYADAPPARGAPDPPGGRFPRINRGNRPVGGADG